MLRKCYLTCAAVLSMAATSAPAATTLTFDGPTAPITPYVEQGFVVDDGGYYIAADGSLHFDIALGPYADNRTIARQGGGGFDLHLLDIISLYPSVSAGGLIGDPMDDIRFEGFSGASLVATATASSQTGNGQASFGGMFRNITSLVITGFDPGNIDYSFPMDVHFLIDNMVVSLPGTDDDPTAPVPLPASGLLLAAAVLGAAAVRRRKPR